MLGVSVHTTHTLHRPLGTHIYYDHYRNAGGILRQAAVATVLGRLGGAAFSSLNDTTPRLPRSLPAARARSGWRCDLPSFGRYILRDILLFAGLRTPHHGGVVY